MHSKISIISLPNSPLDYITDFAAAFSARSSTHDNEKNSGKPISVCKHCKKQWHNKDQCWKHYGHFPRCKKRSSNDKLNSGRAYVSETASTSQLIGLIASQTSSPTLGAVAQSSMPQSLGLINVDGKNPWILDSWATDHLTGSSEHFVSYIPFAVNEKISIANGSLALFAGITCNFTSLMMIPLVVVSLGLVYYLPILAFLNMTSCCGIFG
ncbi:Beta-galactosidase [Cucumis melo var. makuwa]|nr:Beta-galactosidase [Cucumis melo var. makuwa]